MTQMDVKTANLHGDLEEEIYMKGPDRFIVPEKENLVCKLKRRLEASSKTMVHKV